MFHPTLDPRGLSDQELESKVKEVISKINQASRMQNENYYHQLLAINNTLQLEVEKRKLQEAKKRQSDDDQFDGFIKIN